MDRKTGIVGPDEVAATLAQARQGQGRGNKNTGRKTKRPNKTPIDPKQTGIYKLNAKANRNNAQKAKGPQKTKGPKAPKHARLSKTLASKHNHEQLEEIVRGMADEAKAQEFKARNSSKRDLADWIEEQETVIHGPHPNSQLAKTRELRIQWDLQSQSVPNNAESDAYKIQSSTASSSKSQNLSKITSHPETQKAIQQNPPPKHHRSYKEAHQNPVEQVQQPSSQPKPSNKRKQDQILDSSKMPEKSNKRAKVQNDDKTLKHQAPPKAGPKKEKPKVKKPASPEHDFFGEAVLDAFDNDDEAETQTAEQQQQSALDPGYQAPLTLGVGTASITPTPSVPALPKPVWAQSFTTSPLVILPGALTPVSLPQSAAAPPTPIEPTPPGRPYLKLGKHGWDYERSRWSFEGDPDLLTGVGHQIDPADQELVDNNPDFWPAFRERYPGTLVTQWPCGCKRPLGEDGTESEEE